jgi:hypothetical protein
MTSPVTYTEKVPEDGDGKRFLPVAADTGAANELVAILGGAPVTQHGEVFAPMEVSSGQLEASLTAVSAQLPAALSGAGNLQTVIKVPSYTYLPVAQQRMKFKSISASTQLAAAGTNNFAGFIVTASTNGTVKVWNDPAAANEVLMETMTVTAGQIFILPLILTCDTGLYISISNCTITVLYCTDPVYANE